MWVAKNGLCIATIPKVGSSSIKEAFGVCEYLTNEQALKYDERIAFIREPISLLKAGFLQFKRLKAAGNQYISAHGLFPPTDSWENWIDFCLEIEDPHWRSQVDFISIDGEPIATKYHKLENISEDWKHYEKIVGKLQHLNGDEDLEINETYYRQEDILNFFHRDYILWHTV